MATTTAGRLGRRTTHLAAALTLALLLGGGAAHRAAAEDQRPIDTHVSALMQDCNLAGGTPSTDWDFDEGGDATQAVVSCDGLGDQSWYECTDDSGYGCDGEPPSELTGSGGLQLRPGLPGLLINAPIAALPSDQPVVAPGTPPIAAPLTSDGQSTGDSANNGGGTSDATPPGNGNGGVSAGDPGPPSGAVPGPTPAPKPHQGHKHHGHHHPAPAAQHAAGKASHHHHRAKHGK